MSLLDKVKKGTVAVAVQTNLLDTATMNFVRFAGESHTVLDQLSYAPLKMQKLICVEPHESVHCLHQFIRFYVNFGI